MPQVAVGVQRQGGVTIAQYALNDFHIGFSFNCSGAACAGDARLSALDRAPLWDDRRSPNARSPVSHIHWFAERLKVIVELPFAGQYASALSPEVLVVSRVTRRDQDASAQVVRLHA